MKKFLLLSLFVFLSFVFFADSTRAANPGEFIFFRIDTELDVLNDKGVTVEWSCNGTASGSISETAGGIASESTQLIDGIVKVASASKEMTDATCIFNTSDTIRAKASLGGWVTRRWTVALPASTSSPFSPLASMDYTILVNGVADELGTTLTLNGITASATYSGTVASQSYSNGKRYIAGSTSGGTVTGGADGYVNRTSSALTVSSTASQSVDFGTSDSSTLNESGLLFSTKVTINGTTRFGQATNNINGATVTAGNSNSVSCTDNSDGKYYCAVPLAHTGVTANATVIPRGMDDASCTYTDRTAGGDAQSTCTVAAVELGASGSDPTPTPVPSPAVSPTVTPTPTSTPTSTSTITPTPSNTPQSTPITAPLLRQIGGTKVYVQGSDGIMHWVKTEKDFITAGYRWSDIKDIPAIELAARRFGGVLRVIPKIGYLRVRQDPSLKSQILGRVFSGDEFPFSKISADGWYYIQKNTLAGWVFGKYISEI